MSEFTIKRATRQGVRPLIGLYGESGTGKTYSALLLARGFVGASGRIGMLDTESGRGSLYADVLPGGYDVLEMDAPFSPARYIDAMRALHGAGAQIIIIDSVSHEWEGIGGVLDMAGENEHKSGRAGLHNWKTPKMEHAKMVGAMLQAPVPLVVCIRAKFKTRQIKENGKTAIVKDDYTSPIQSEEFIFEMTAHGEVMGDHSLRLTKCSHPALRECFASGKPISIATGEALAKWCNASPAQSAASPSPSPSPASTAAPASANKQPAGSGGGGSRLPSRDKMIDRLHEVTRGKHDGTTAGLVGWLLEHNCMQPEETFADLELARLIEVGKAASAAATASGELRL